MIDFEIAKDAILDAMENRKLINLPKDNGLDVALRIIKEYKKRQDHRQQ